jgi:hypothetical protein
MPGDGGSYLVCNKRIIQASGKITVKTGIARLPVVRALVKAQPDALLGELCERFAEKTGIQVSVSMMQRAVRRLELSVKKTLIATEQQTQRVKDLRFAYRVWSLTVDPRNLVFIDETEMYLGLTHFYGRASKGKRLYDTESPGNRG